MFPKWKKTTFGMKEEKWREVNCTLCNGNSYKVIFSDKITSEDKSFTFNIVQCLKCGFIYNNPINLDKIGYTFGSIDANKAAKSEYVRKFKIYSYALNLLDKMNMTESKNLLDIGCGCGTFLDMARSNRWNVKGIELAESQYKYAREHLKLDVVRAENLDILINSYKQHFDVVTMWDVLEHIADPKDTLLKVSVLLKPGGILMLKIPNSSLQIKKAKLARLFFPRMEKILGAGDHVVHFTHRTILRMLIETNFNPILLENSKLDRSHYSPFAIFKRPYYYLSILVEKTTGLHIGNYYFIVARSEMK